MTESDVLIRITVPQAVVTAAFVNENRSALRAYLKAQCCSMIDQIEASGDLETFVNQALAANTEGPAL